MELRFSGATIGYGRTTVLDRVTFEVPEGTATALVGGNGTGKSTVLKSVLGLSTILAGSVEVGGVDARKLPPGTVGYVPQSVAVEPEFPITAAGVVSLGLAAQLRPFGRIGAAGRRRCMEALRAVDLADRAGARFNDLSGGQRQRVLLARALVSEPEVLLLDEPFNGLDADSRDRLIQLINDLKNKGLAVLLSTHDLRLSEETCDTTLVVGAGTVG